MDTCSDFSATFLKGNNYCDFSIGLSRQQSPSKMGSALEEKEHILSVNPIAPREAKIVYNFGLSECKLVKN